MAKTELNQNQINKNLISFANSSTITIKDIEHYYSSENISALTVSADSSFNSVSSIAEIDFASDSTSITLTSSSISYSGDDCSEGTFTPVVSSRYCIMFYYDGLSIQAVVKKSI